MAKIRLKLHQKVVGARAAVRTQRLQGNTGVLLHRTQHIRRLIGKRFQHRTHDLCAAGAARQSNEHAAGIRVPVRRAQAGKRRHKIYPARVLH